MTCGDVFFQWEILLLEKESGAKLLNALRSIDHSKT